MKQIVSLIFIITIFSGCATSANVQSIIDKGVSYSKETYNSIKEKVVTPDQKKYPDAEKIAIEYSMASYLINREAMLDYESEIEIRRVASSLRRALSENNREINKDLSDKDLVFKQISDITAKQKEFFNYRGKNGEEFKVEKIIEKDGLLIVITKLYNAPKDDFFRNRASDYLFQIDLKKINNKWQVVEMSSSLSDRAVFRSVDIEHKIKTDPRITFANEYANEQIKEQVNSKEGQEFKKNMTEKLRSNGSVSAMRTLVSDEEKFKAKVRNQILAEMTEEKRNNLTEEEKETMEKQIDVLYNKMKDSPLFSN